MIQTGDSFEQGSHLAFVLGAFRSGTTLLRKVLDTHTRLCSPAETWFLLPLLNLWDGLGEAPHYKPKQAAAAIRSHLDSDGFLSCCRAFAARFYAQGLCEGSRYFIDKTPPYLSLAPALPRLFPRAKFIVLTRDPRGIVWSRQTWVHTPEQPIESLAASVASDLRELSEFVERTGERSLTVSYERLCLEPEHETARMCGFLDVEPERAMVMYGARDHHEGYGDETTRKHNRPHAASVSRWEGGLSDSESRLILDACGEPVMKRLGLADANQLEWSRG